MTEKRVLRRVTELKSSRNWESPRKRRYNAWSPTEMDHLLAGYKKHGSKWSAILQDPEFSFQPDRVPTDLFRKWKAISFRSEQLPTSDSPEDESAPLSPKDTPNNISNTESATEFLPPSIPQVAKSPENNPIKIKEAKSGRKKRTGREKNQETPVKDAIPKLQKRGGKRGVTDLVKSFEGNKESESAGTTSVSKTPTSSKKIPTSSKKKVKETPSKGKRKNIEVLIKKPAEKIENGINQGDAQKAVLSGGSEEKPIIDKIVGYRIDGEGKEKVLVAWGGMKSDDSPTWESIDSLDNCSVKLQSYLIENRQRVSQILVSPTKVTKANENTSSQLLQLAPHLKSAIPALTITEKSILESLRSTPLKRKAKEPLPMETEGYNGGNHSSSEESNSVDKAVNTTPPHPNSELPESIDTIEKINVHMRKRRKFIATPMSEMKRNQETRQENNGICTSPSMRRTRGYDKSLLGNKRQQSRLMTKLSLSPITKPTEVSLAFDTLFGGKLKGQKGKEPDTSRIQGNSSHTEESLQSSIKKETGGVWDYRKWIEILWPF